MFSSRAAATATLVVVAEIMMIQQVDEPIWDLAIFRCERVSC